MNLLRALSMQRCFCRMISRLWWGRSTWISEVFMSIMNVLLLFMIIRSSGILRRISEGPLRNAGGLRRGIIRSCLFCTGCAGGSAGCLHRLCDWKVGQASVLLRAGRGSVKKVCCFYSCTPENGIFLTARGGVPGKGCGRRQCGIHAA